MAIANFDSSGIPYYKPALALSKGHIYSCDKLRLGIDFSTRLNEFINYMTHLSGYDMRFDIKYYPSYSAWKYRHMWQIKDTLSGYSWAVGVSLKDTVLERSRGFIEFNPNKCMNSPLFLEFWETFDKLTIERNVVRYDVAIDIQKPRLEFRLVRVGRPVFHTVMSDTGYTEYLGTESHNGFVKLYDKQGESGLNESWTRLEITLDKGTQLESVFPTVYYTDSQQTLMDLSGLSSTQSVLVQMARQMDNPSLYLSQLDFKLRKKIEPYIADTTLSCDNHAFNEVRLVAYSFEKVLTRNNTHCAHNVQADPSKHDMSAYSKYELKEMFPSLSSAPTQAEIEADIAEKMEEIFG